jgi:hypothetical protein
MIELIVFGGAVVLLLSLTAVIVFPFLLVEYIGFRRSLWIAVSPGMISVTSSQLPPDFAQLFEAVRPVLEEAARGRQ